MTRLLERSGIEELEVLFAKKGVTVDELFALAEELSFRSTSRAEKLLSQVVESLRLKQLFARAKVVVDEKRKRATDAQGSLDLDGAQGAPASIHRQLPQTPTLEKTASKSVDTVIPTQPNLSTEQAYKLLKVPMLASWEQIELSRRELVARAQPDRLVGLTPDKRKALQEDCRMVNAAYCVLLQTKG